MEINFIFSERQFFPDAKINLTYGGSSYKIFFLEENARDILTSELKDKFKNSVSLALPKDAIAVAVYVQYSFPIGIPKTIKFDYSIYSKN